MAEKNPGTGILRSDIYNIRFYEKLPFYGSWRGMHYRIMGVDGAAAGGADGEADGGADGAVSDGTAAGGAGGAADGGADGEADAGVAADGGAAKQLCVTVWPGPYNFETTDEALKVSEYFDFSNEGLDAVTEYLNEYYVEHFA